MRSLRRFATTPTRMAFGFPRPYTFFARRWQKSPHPLVRGVACLSLAQDDHRLVATGQRMRDPITREPLVELYSKNPKALEAARNNRSQGGSIERPSPC